MKTKFTIFAFFAISILSVFFSPKFFAAQYFDMTVNTRVTVMQVIDGDSLRVRTEDNDEIVLVRLAGIETAGIRAAQQFMSQQLLGRSVDLLLSSHNVPTDRFDDRWIPVYLTYNNVNYNRALVQRGLARVDPTYQFQWLHSTLVADQASASIAGLGIWENTGFSTPLEPNRWLGDWVVAGPYWQGLRVNINTATATQLNQHLTGISLSLAQDIVNHRISRPFTSINQLMEVVSRAQFDQNSQRLVISTNINMASETELMQLINVTLSQAREIIRVRNIRQFTHINQLREQNILPTQTFELNRPFINVDAPGWGNNWNNNWQNRLNVNTATASQLTALAWGFSFNFADVLVAEARRLPFRNFNELRNFFDRHGELALYYRIEHLLAVDNVGGNWANWLNVNTATASEWMNFTWGVPWDFATALANEAQRLPFRSWNELRNFFDRYGFLELYNRIQPFLTL
ncbi:MAG: helix-hairpin-helix domain-containing protein [Firmicutes bacterium]|nr:helix-hairpin-helix domain-containing protein [Bacillota bacterium]